MLFSSFSPLSLLPAHCPFNIPIINIYIIAVHSHLSSASSVKIQSLKLRTWWNGCSHEFGEGFDVQKAKKVSHELELRTLTLTDLVTALWSSGDIRAFILKCNLLIFCSLWIFKRTDHVMATHLFWDTDKSFFFHNQACATKTSRLTTRWYQNIVNF